MKEENIYTVLFGENEVIGTIDFGDDVITEHNIGGRLQLGSIIGTCTVEIVNLEGKNYPHFHIKTPKYGVLCCPMIYSPFYFNHSGKEYQLNSKQKQIFNDFMKSYNPKYNMTNWEYGSKYWTEKYGKSTDFTSVQPDYTKLRNIR